MIKNISFEQQRDTMDCGVSCLIMTAGYYGKSTDRDRLRLLSDLSKDGVSLLGISKAAVKTSIRIRCSSSWTKPPMPLMPTMNEPLQKTSRSSTREKQL